MNFASSICVFLICSYLATVAAKTQNIVGSIPSAEYQALNNLYLTTNGAQWRWRSDFSVYGYPWNFTVLSSDDLIYNNPCSQNWQGVGCICDDAANVCNVQLLQLNNYSLSGLIPHSIGDLTELTVLDLGKNKLHSTLPSSLGKLIHLESFIVNLNHQLSGSIPEGLYDALNMTYFDVSDNILSGSISTHIGQWSRLDTLYLDHNMFTNTIPESIGSCLTLTTIEMEVNHFNGSIPSSIGSLSNLHMLLLYNNEMTGSLPTTLGNLENIVYLEIYNNQLDGSIPTELCALSKLQVLEIFNNQLVGNLPECIGNLHSLNYLEIYGNYLTGSLPDSLYNLINLQYLELYRNYLSGTLSESINKLHNLTFIQLQMNQFEGSIPNEICSLKKLLVLDLSNNILSGTIPNAIGSVRPLNYLYLYSNHLTQDIPTSIATLPVLSQLVLWKNYFTGVVTPSLGSVKSLQYLDLHQNLFSGHVPLIFANLQRLFYLSLYANILSGTVPKDLSMLPLIQNIFLHGNRFTGTLDGIVDTTLQTRLTNIDVSVNELTGTIPTEIYQLKALATFGAATNCFSGTLSTIACESSTLTALSLDGMSSSTTCRQLLFPHFLNIETYGLNKKYHHGTIPPCLLTIPQLETLHLSGNGLTGTIASDRISTTLSDLSLSHNVLYGTIPHALGGSGNRVKHTSILTDTLSLSSIIINGNNSTSFKAVNTDASWKNLDLGYNKFSGTLNQNIRTPQKGQSISLQVNRLSGDIPPTLHNAVDINILDGNRFTCSTGIKGEEELPVNDPTRDVYDCGSNSFNIAFYLWISLTLSVSVIVLYVMYVKYTLYNHTDHEGVVESRPMKRKLFTRCYQKFTQWLYRLIDNMLLYMSVYNRDNSTQSSSHAVIELGTFLSNMRLLFTLLTLFICAICLPVYCILSLSYSMYEYEYAWFYSIAFLSGVYPGIVLFVILLVFLSVLIMLSHKYMHSMYRSTLNALKLHDNSWCSKHTAKYIVFVSCLLMLNTAVVLVVNGVYIYITTHYNRVIVTTTQLAMAIFKLTWNSAIVFSLFDYLKRTYFRDDIDGEGEGELDNNKTTTLSMLTMRTSNSTWSRKIHSRDILVQSFIVMFNSIACPCLAVSIVSSNCFYYAFFNPPEIVAQYTFDVCNNVLIKDGSCLSPSTATIAYKYHPPFNYSYQCSSTFITTYSSVYIYMFMLSSFGVPLLMMFGVFLHKFIRKDSLWFRLVDAALPEMLKPLEADNLQHSSVAPISSSSSNRDSSLSVVRDSDVNGSNDFDTPTTILTGLEGRGGGGTVGTRASMSSLHVQIDTKDTLELMKTNQVATTQSVTPPLLLMDKYMANLVCNLGVLVTFGALFPPLAVVILISTVTNNYRLQYLIGRTLIHAEKYKLLSYCYRIDDECEDIKKAFRHVVFLQLFFACLFYAFFLFDILGDRVGWSHALWAPITLCVVPFVVYLLRGVIVILIRCINCKERDAEKIQQRKDVKYSAVQHDVHTNTL